MSGDPQEGRAGVVSAVGSIGLATLASRVLGYVRDMVVAQAFGAGPVTDAFFVAFRIPNLLRRLLAEGALSTAVIPVFTAVPRHRRTRRLRHHGPRGGGRERAHPLRGDAGGHAGGAMDRDADGAGLGGGPATARPRGVAHAADVPVPPAGGAGRARHRHAERASPVLDRRARPRGAQPLHDRGGAAAGAAFPAAHRLPRGGGTRGRSGPAARPAAGGPAPRRPPSPVR